MKGCIYGQSGDSVQLSFKHSSHENLAVTATASTSLPLSRKEVFLSLVVAAHVKIGSGDANSTDFVLPAGVWPLLVDEGDTISVLKLTGGVDGQASIIITEI